MNTRVDFYDIYGYYHVPFYKTYAFAVCMWILGFLCLALFAYFIIRLILKKRLERELAADFWALKQLKKLSVDRLTTKQEFKRFYFRLTEIIKVYLHKRYSWPTLDKTDDELLKFLENKEFDEALLERLKVFSGGALFVKFAGEDVLKIQAEKDLNLVYVLIQDTQEGGDKAQSDK